MKNERLLRHLRFLLGTLIVVLTFEGLFRKTVTGMAGKVTVFFLKDFLVVLIGFYVLRLPKPPSIAFLGRAYGIVAIFFIPPVVFTALHDPLLAIFGLKQYLLFPVVAIGMFVAFEDVPTKKLIAFLRWTAFLVIPTSLLALIQLRLPADHWLNLSVGGGNLGGFGASGLLRVSSSFPFVAQYAMFLNAQMFYVVATLYFLKSIKWWWKALYLSLPLFLIVGSYITGSRGAVVGNTAILALALGLIAFKGQATRALHAAFLVALLYLAFFVVKDLFPSSFVVYSAREEGQLLGVSQEIQQRTYDMLFSWLGGIPGAPSSLFGYGLGVMSNGSDSLSDYARIWRGGGNWTETDCATTLFEGGFYLIFVWYGFRGFIIFATARRFFSSISPDFIIPAAFCQGYVSLIGFVGTLGIQPPMAIWWWLAVGTALLFWRKSVEPLEEQASPDTTQPIPAPLTRTLRGRSAYAERLHSEK